MKTTAQVREHHQIKLAASVLRSGGSVRLRVFGTSMLPSLWPGDILTVENDPKNRFVPGDIVLRLRDGKLLAHRLLANRGTRWITRGDAMPQSDPPAEVEDLLGRVVRIERNRHSLLAPRISRPTRGLAWILGHSDLIRSLVLRLHSTWLRRQRCHVSEAEIGELGTSRFFIPRSLRSA